MSTKRQRGTLYSELCKQERPRRFKRAISKCAQHVMDAIVEMGPIRDIARMVVDFAGIETEAWRPIESIDVVGHFVYSEARREGLRQVADEAWIDEDEKKERSVSLLMRRDCHQSNCDCVPSRLALVSSPLLYWLGGRGLWTVVLKKKNETECVVIRALDYSFSTCLCLFANPQGEILFRKPRWDELEDSRSAYCGTDLATVDRGTFETLRSLARAIELRDSSLGKRPYVFELD
jgi:hypothetical protein